MSAFLLRLYPARWRARYADEFELILADRPLGPFDVADILLGALDAHLHLRGLDAASHGKGFAMTLPIGGFAAILGGLLWFVALTGNAINNGGEAGSSWIGIALLGAVITTLVALVGLSAFQARRFPRLMWAAFAIPGLAAVVALLGVVAIALTGNSDQEIIAGFSGWGIATIGLLGLLVGSGLFAIGTWLAQSLSRGAAALLGAGALVVVFGLTGLSGGFVPRELSVGALLISILAFPGGWAALGVSALRLDRAGAARLEGALP